MFVGLLDLLTVLYKSSLISQSVASLSQAKQVHVKLDDRIISPPEGFLLRKGELFECFELL